MWRRCRKSSRLRPGSRKVILGARMPSGMTAIPPCGGTEVRATDTASNTLIWLQPMNSLLLGPGGREHALAWKIAASPLVTKLWCAPGNAGIAREAECVALDIADHAAVIDFCRTTLVVLVVAAREPPLAAGTVDVLAAADITAFGPSRQASQLEGSKGFTK